MPETLQGMLARVESMATGSPSWDLSPNDIAALKHVLDLLRFVQQQNAELAKGTEQLVRQLREAQKSSAEDRAPKGPRRRWLVEINVGGDELEDVLREILRMAEHVQEHGKDCSMVSGGYSTGGFVRITENPDMTHDRYFEEIERWKAEKARLEAAAGQEVPRG